MVMMGLKGWLNWVAWFVKCVTFLFITMLIITLLLCARFGKENGKMLEHSDPTLVFFFLFMYAISGKFLNF